MFRCKVGWLKPLSDAHRMKPIPWLTLSLRHKPWRPRPLRWIVQDWIGVARQPEHDPRTHLRATIEWVCRAQDACHPAPDRGGVAAGWTFESGWLPGCMDTTGWLIETCLPAAEYLAWPHLTRRVRGMLDALLAQADGPGLGRIHGLIAGHVQLGHPDCLAQAVRSGYALLDAPLVSLAHRAQTAHTLAILGVMTQDATLTRAAHHHLDTVLAQQTASGWFGDTAAPVSTSALAGVLRSLIELGVLLDDARALGAAQLAAQALRDRQHGDGGLAGAYDDSWKPAASHVCVSGLAQMAACWLRLAQIESAPHWRDAASRALAWIKRNQRTEGDDLALRDALPSTVPIWSGPGAFSFHALNAKYFADALMMDMVGIMIPPLAQKVEAV